MKIYDISWPISQATTGYKDKKIIMFEEIRNINRDGVRETAITLSSHTGTHIDAPSHFFKDGKTIDEISLDRLIGTAVVLDLTTVQEEITWDDLEPLNDKINKDQIVLFKTINSDIDENAPFTPHFVYLHESGAEFLVQKKVKAVGIDYLGIERSQPDHMTHKTLMNHDILVIEGLRLEDVPAGNYEMYCLPLYVIGLEAAPARAILVG